MSAGYSGTPLAKKLGIKQGFRILVVNSPDEYEQLLAPLPDDVEICEGVRSNVDLAHLFTNTRDVLFNSLANLRHLIKQDGTIWVSWFKKASKQPTEINEDDIRAAAFPLGLADVKVCAVDDRWSGLKLVIRKELRKATR